AMMQGTYAGGESFSLRGHTRTIDHTASAGVVFACLPGGDRLRQPGSSQPCGMDRPLRPCRSSDHNHPLAAAARPLPALVLFTVYVCASLRPVPGRGTPSILSPQLQSLPHCLLQ